MNREAFTAAQRAYDAQMPEVSDLYERAENRVSQLSIGEIRQYMERFCDSNEPLHCETTDGKWITSRKSIETLFCDWLQQCVEREIEREGRA